jgi:hypothetical protein
LDLVFLINPTHSDFELDCKITKKNANKQAKSKLICFSEQERFQLQLKKEKTKKKVKNLHFLKNNRIFAKIINQKKS